MAKLEPIYLANVLFYVRGMTNFINLRQVSKNTTTAFEMLHVNPQNISAGVNWIFRVFPNINTVQGSCHYVLSEIKGDKLDKVTWVDASLATNEGKYITPLICDKIRKLKIDQTDYDLIFKCYYLDTLIIKDVSNPDLFCHIDKHQYLKKVIIYLSFNSSFTTFHQLKRNCLKCKGVKFSIVFPLISGETTIKKEENVLLIERNIYEKERKVETKELKTKTIKIVGMTQSIVEDLINECNKTIYDEVIIEIEEGEGELDLTRLKYCLLLKVNLKQGDIKMKCSDYIKSIHLETIKGIIEIDLNSIKDLQSLTIIGNVKNNGRYEYSIQSQLRHFFINSTKTCVVNTEKINNIQTFHLDADFKEININIEKNYSAKQVFIANKQIKGNVFIKQKFIYKDTTNDYKIIGRGDGLYVDLEFNGRRMEIEGRILSVDLRKVNCDFLRIDTDKRLKTNILLPKGKKHFHIYSAKLVLKSNCNITSLKLTQPQCFNDLEIDCESLKELHCFKKFSVSAVAYNYKTRILHYFDYDNAHLYISQYSVSHGYVQRALNNIRLKKDPFLKNVKGVENIKVVMSHENNNNVLLSDIVKQKNETSKDKDKKKVYIGEDDEDYDEDYDEEEDVDSPYLIH